MLLCGAGAAQAAAFEPLDRTVCRLIENAAHANGLPVGFMTRIIWRESSFRAAAVSPMGAQGIAQFMPGTAQQRGLADPFDPEEAIPKAARLLAELRRKFGNLGAAAAAYNAGSARVALWLRGEANLPAETQTYVRRVTAQDAEDWKGAAGNASDGGATTDGESCLAVTAELRLERGGDGILGFFQRQAGDLDLARLGKLEMILEGLGDCHSRGAVDDDAHRPSVAVFDDEHDRLEEIRIAQISPRDQELSA